MKKYILYTAYLLPLITYGSGLPYLEPPMHVEDACFSLDDGTARVSKRPNPYEDPGLKLSNSFDLDPSDSERISISNPPPQPQCDPPKEGCIGCLKKFFHSFCAE
jgi:hypothetical protein